MVYFDVFFEFLTPLFENLRKTFSAGSVYLGDYFTILGNVLVYGNDLRQTYRIKGYQADFIYAESDDALGYKSPPRWRGLFVLTVH